MHNFTCINCNSLIQVEYNYIGEIVECPVCSCPQIVPDPFLPAGFDYHGYIIERHVNSDLLWKSYIAADSANGDRKVIVKIPTMFFLHNTEDFAGFISVLTRNGLMQRPEYPKLLTHSVSPGKVFFVFEHLVGAHRLSTYCRQGAMNPELSLQIIRKIAVALQQTWDKDKTIHQNLNPDNVRFRHHDQAVFLTEMGLSTELLNNRKLLEKGFSIWDPHYLAPEFILKGQAATPATDIYATGCLFYLLISGHVPYEGITEDRITSSVLTAPF